jgi:hypothetical protein
MIRRLMPATHRRQLSRRRSASQSRRSPCQRDFLSSDFIDDPGRPLITMSEGDQEKDYDALSQVIEKYMAGERDVV